MCRVDMVIVDIILKEAKFDEDYVLGAHLPRLART